jgi:hypothetical protein
MRAYLTAEEGEANQESMPLLNVSHGWMRATVSDPRPLPHAFLGTGQIVCQKRESQASVCRVHGGINEMMTRVGLLFIL